MEPTTPADKPVIPSLGKGMVPVTRETYDLTTMIFSPEPRLRTELEDDIIQALRRKDIISERLYQNQKNIHQLEVDLKHAHKVLLDTISTWQKEVIRKRKAKEKLKG